MIVAWVQRIRQLFAYRSSLYHRLLWTMTISVLLAFAAMGWFLTDTFQRFLQQQWQQTLQVSLDEMTALLEFHDNAPPFLPKSLADPRFSHSYSGWYWQIRKPSGEVVLRSRSLWDTSLELPLISEPQQPFLLQSAVGPQKEPLYVLSRWVYPLDQPEQRVRLEVAADVSNMTDAQRRWGQTMVMGFAVLVAGLFSLLLLQIYRGLYPLRQLKNDILHMTSGNTPERVTPYPSELQPLVQALQTVRAHDHAVVLRARTQAGNLAHALKTPMSVILSASEKESSPFATLVQEQLGYAQRHIQYHLAQTRAAAAAVVPGQSVLVSSSLSRLTHTFQKLYPQVAIDSEQVSQDSVLFKGEEQDFYEIVGNVVENACKWAHHAVQITVKLNAHYPDDFWLMVDDDGRGLPPEEWASVLQRGVRADQTQQGSGIGLSIVHELVILYGGELQLRQSTLGGLGVTIRLPKVIPQ